MLWLMEDWFFFKCLPTSHTIQGVKTEVVDTLVSYSMVITKSKFLLTMILGY